MDNTIEYTSNTPNKLEQYIKRHLPEYIRDINYQSFSYRTLKMMQSKLVENIQGLESLPAGEKLFIAKHNNGKDIWKLLVALDEKIHIVASETIHYKDKLLFGSKGVVMKWLEMLPIKETFSNIEMQNKDKIIKKAPFLERDAHRRILNRSKGQEIGNFKYLRQIVATLVAGQNVELFVDGPWTRLEDDQRIPYAGYGLIAKMYYKVTGKKLNIVPVNFQDKAVIIGSAFKLSGVESKEELQLIAKDKIDKLN